MYTGGKLKIIQILARNIALLFESSPLISVGFDIHVNLSPFSSFWGYF